MLAKMVARPFDAVDRWWGREATQRGLAGLLIWCFLVTALVVELARRGMVPQKIFLRSIPHSHFFALEVAFTLLLVAEVVTLVLGMARSMGEAVGHQFEVLALILIRQSFKELGHFSEPIRWTDVRHAVPWMLSDAFGALAIFVLVNLFFRLQRHQAICPDPSENESFIRSKKIIALLLLVALGVLGGTNAERFFTGRELLPGFEVFYTLLIFADVLVVLLSLRLTTRFAVAFRYFGFAVATVLVRLALTAPRMLDAALGIAGVVFAIALSWAYNTFAQPGPEEGSVTSSG